MTLLEEIKEKKRELEELEKKYMNSVGECKNLKCSFYNTKSTMNCNWTLLVEECKDYAKF